MRSNIGMRHLALISYKNFLQRPWRNLIISIAMSVGLIGVFLALGLGNGITNLLNSDSMKSQIPTSIQVQSNPESGRALESTDINQIKNVSSEETRYVAKLESYFIQSISIDGKELNFSEKNMPAYSQVSNLLNNVDESNRIDQLSTIKAGPEYKKNTEDGISIPNKLIEDLNKKKKTNFSSDSIIGTKVKINMNGTSKTYTVQRVLDDDTNLFLTTKNLDQFVKESNQAEQITSLLIELKNPSKNDVVTKEINNNKKYMAMSSSGILDTMTQFIEVIQGLLIFMSSQAIVVAVVLLGVVLFINVIERTKEIGIMKAVGYQNIDISLIFIFEGVYIALISYGISYIFSYLIGIAINVGVKHYTQIPMAIFSISPISAVYILLATLLMVLLAVFIPIRKISQLDAAQSLRYE